MGILLCEIWINRYNSFFDDIVGTVILYSTLNMAPTKQNGNFVWKHFLKKEKCIAKCKHIKKDIRSGSNTTNRKVYLEDDDHNNNNKSVTTFVLVLL